MRCDFINVKQCHMSRGQDPKNNREFEDPCMFSRSSHKTKKMLSAIFNDLLCNEDEFIFIQTLHLIQRCKRTKAKKGFCF